MSAVAIAQISNLVPQVDLVNEPLATDVLAMPSPNIIDGLSSAIDNNFNNLLAEQLTTAGLIAANTKNPNKISSRSFLETQASVDELTLDLQVTSKITSSVVKSIDTLIHTQ